MFFHKDTAHTYTSDKSVLQNGAVYGLKDRRPKKSDSATKVTAIKLILIKLAKEFEKRLVDIADVSLTRLGRRNV